MGGKRVQKMKRIAATIMGGFLFSTVCLADNPYRVETFESNGKLIDRIVVPGRPPAIKAQAVAVPAAQLASGINVLTNVPAFTWSYGCSATSAAMMMGYYDNNGYPNMYAGSSNGGVCPLNNETYWGHTVYASVTCGECPLAATHSGYDGRTIRGHVDDYWVDYEDDGDDPYITGNWTEHAQGDCTADYMGTNQSKYDNSDGATTFYSYTDGTPLYDYTPASTSIRDGCHGIRLFAESRGYTVTGNFSQYIYGYDGNTIGFTFADFKSEIDAGRPVLIQVEGHTMLGYGYNTSGSLVYIHDTWDNSNHSMTWGGTYSGMQHYGVVVVQLGSIQTTPSAPTNVSADDGASTASVGISWTASSGATGYGVYRCATSSSSSASLLGSASGASYTDNTADPGALYYYWVKATNSAGSSAFSSPDTGYRALSAPSGVSATESSTGAVTVTWSSATSASSSYYRVYRSATSSGTKTALGSWQTALSYSDTLGTAGTTYYYWVVAAVDSSGTRASAYSNSDTGVRLVGVALAVALDTADLTWTTGGSADWFGQTSTSYDGADAARTGAIGASQTTWLQTSVSGAGTLTFWWRSSCEDSPDDDWDYLAFLVDGVEQARIDGSNAWRQVSATLASGDHTLRWGYVKDDADEIVYEDCGWVDQVVWSSGGSTTNTPVAVPYAWLSTYGLAPGGDYEAAAKADADGDGFAAWQEFVAGTVPTNVNSVVTASIVLSNGMPFVTWTPDLGTERVYTVEGKSSLTNAAWLSPTNAASRFFRVNVAPR